MHMLINIQHTRTHEHTFRNKIIDTPTKEKILSSHILITYPSILCRYLEDKKMFWLINGFSVDHIFLTILMILRTIIIVIMVMAMHLLKLWEWNAITSLSCIWWPKNNTRKVIALKKSITIKPVADLTNSTNILYETKLITHALNNKISMCILKDYEKTHR